MRLKWYGGTKHNLQLNNTKFRQTWPRNHKGNWNVQKQTVKHSPPRTSRTQNMWRTPETRGHYTQRRNGTGDWPARYARPRVLPASPSRHWNVSAKRIKHIRSASPLLFLASARTGFAVANEAGRGSWVAATRIIERRAKCPRCSEEISRSR
jgi:hypothetical protein